MLSQTTPLREDVVEFVDLRSQMAEILDDLQPDLTRILSSAAFIGGPDVDEFERSYAEFVGTDHCVGVANGTDAIELALRALDIGAGDEVVLPANTFIATAEAVARTGASPVLVDVDPETLLIDVGCVINAVTNRTRAVLPVHLFGQVAPVEQLSRGLDGSGVVIVEDASQSQGASRYGVTSGALGVLASTSFYPGKNLGAAGDAGAVTMSDPELASRVRLLGAHGSPRKYVHDILGFNSRLDAVQAAVLKHKLRRLPGWNESRRKAAARYDDLMVDLPDVVLPRVLEGNVHAWHLYVVRVPHRDSVLSHLNANGVGAAIHYPVPVHLTGAFASLGHSPGDFPVSEAAATSILSLPMHGHLTELQQERVVDVLADALTLGRTSP